MVKEERPRTKKTARHPVHFSWSNVELKTGIRPTFVPPSPYIDQTLLPPDISNNYWRDVAIFRDMNKRLEAYSTVRDYKPDSVALKIAEQRALDHFQQHIPAESLLPATFTEVWRNMRLTTSSGYPFYQKKGTLREYCFRDYARTMRRCRQKRPLSFHPCTAAARNAVRPRPDNKPRLVWVYPIDVTTLEGIFMVPLQRACSGLPSLGWTFRWLDNGSGYRDMMQALTKGVSMLEVDFSGFDASIEAPLIRAAFRIIKSLFDLDATHRHLFLQLQDYFINTPLITWRGVVQKRRGVPSGSYFTQLVDSIVNIIGIYYLQERVPDHFKVDWFSVLGDDSLQRWNFNWTQYDLPVLVDIYREIALEVHPEKIKIRQLIGKQNRRVGYLGHELSMNWPHFNVDLEMIAARALYPEAPDKHPAQTWIRLVGLTWSYGMNIQAYKMLTRLIAKLEYEHPFVRHDARLLGTTDPEVKRWFEFVFNEYEIEATTLPTHRELHLRYIGYA